MGVVVDRRPADIHPHLRGIDRREGLLAARRRIIERQGVVNGRGHGDRGSRLRAPGPCGRGRGCRQSGRRLNPCRRQPRWPAGGSSTSPRISAEFEQPQRLPGQDTPGHRPRAWPRPIFTSRCGREFHGRPAVLFRSGPVPRRKAASRCRQPHASRVSQPQFRLTGSIRATLSGACRRCSAMRRAWTGCCRSLLMPASARATPRSRSSGTIARTAGPSATGYISRRRSTCSSGRPSGCSTRPASTNGRSTRS